MTKTTVTSFDLPYPKTPCGTQTAQLELELLQVKVLHCRNRDFRHFLLLWPVLFLDLHIWTIHDEFCQSQ